MREPTKKQLHIESQLLYLFEQTYKQEKNWEIDLVKEYIEVCEWGLAADTMAFQYLSGERTLTKKIYSVFVDLAEQMKLLENDMWRSIQELLSNPPTEAS